MKNMSWHSIPSHSHIVLTFLCWITLFLLDVGCLFTVNGQVVTELQTGESQQR